MEGFDLTKAHQYGWSTIPTNVRAKKDGEQPDVHDIVVVKHPTRETDRSMLHGFCPDTQLIYEGPEVTVAGVCISRDTGDGTMDPRDPSKFATKLCTITLSGLVHVHNTSSSVISFGNLLMAGPSTPDAKDVTRPKYDLTKTELPRKNPNYCTVYRASRVLWRLDVAALQALFASAAYPVLVNELQRSTPFTLMPAYAAEAYRRIAGGVAANTLFDATFQAAQSFLRDCIGECDDDITEVDGGDYWSHLNEERTVVKTKTCLGVITMYQLMAKNLIFAVATNNAGIRQSVQLLVRA